LYQSAKVYSLIMRKLPASEQPTQLVSQETPAFFKPARRRGRQLGLGAFVLALGASFTLVLVGVAVTQLDWALVSQNQTRYEVVERPLPITVAQTTGEAASKIALSPLFTPEVQFWQPLIAEWALAWEIDPNLIATVIQIESCGNPNISSSAGAQGLFQVMPFHFEPGENMTDIQNNAKRGLAYLNGGLDRSEGNAGLALAGYNGGHSVISKGYAAWHSETRRYYYWGTGIYMDARAGKASSERLQEWLAAGGQSLCDKARQAQQGINLYQTSNGG
jgi:soluble lytic murein transglycosylase-like protein